MTLTTPLSGRFVNDRLGHAMIQLSNKFKVPNFTHYGSMKGVAKCRKWGGYRTLKVIENSTIRQSAYELLLAFHSKYVTVLHRF